jgi:hypothetical protein
MAVGPRPVELAAKRGLDGVLAAERLHAPRACVLDATADAPGRSVGGGRGVNVGVADLDWESVVVFSRLVKQDKLTVWLGWLGSIEGRWTSLLFVLGRIPRRADLEWFYVGDDGLSPLDLRDLIEFQTL